MGIHIHKAYTRTGDAGETGIVGGRRVGKDDARIEAYGTVDETQAQVGLLRAALCEAGGEKAAAIARELHAILNDLFDVGSILATPAASRAGKKFDAARIAALEKRMDEWTKDLPPLDSFVLAGGGKYSALAHLARTVCRRAERAAVRFHRIEPLPEEVLKYLNRLSDYLFVLARHLAKTFGEKEDLWETPRR